MALTPRSVRDLTRAGAYTSVAVDAVNGPVDLVELSTARHVVAVAVHRHRCCIGAARAAGSGCSAASSHLQSLMSCFAGPGSGSACRAQLLCDGARLLCTERGCCVTSVVVVLRVRRLCDEHGCCVTSAAVVCRARLLCDERGCCVQSAAVVCRARLLCDEHGCCVQSTAVV